MRTTMMAGVLVWVVLGVMCAGRQPSIPSRGVASYGQSAAMRFRDGEFKKALQLYTRAREEAARFDIPLLEAQYLFNCGRIYYECAMFDSAQSCFSVSRAIFDREKACSETAVAGIFESLARAYRGELDSARALFRAWSLQVNTDDALTVASAAMILNLLEGMPAEALRYGDSACSILARKRDDFSLGCIYYYRAMAVFMMGDRIRSNAYLDSSLARFEQASWRYRNWKTLLGKAIIAYCANDTLSGRTYYHRAEKAAPDMIVFPDESLVRRCPLTW